MNLSGTDGRGHKRPWLIEEAANHPFWTDRKNDERVAKPVFQDTLLSPFNRGIKSILDAMENTVNGQAVDPKKPHFEGLYADNLVDFAKSVKELQSKLPADDTVIVRKAKLAIAENQAIVDAAEKQTA